MQKKTEDVPLGDILLELVSAVGKNHTVEVYFDDSKLVNAISQPVSIQIDDIRFVEALNNIAFSIDGLADAIREKKKSP